MKIQFAQPICGICEQPGATKLWYNQRSNLAHPICLQCIDRENKALQSLLDEIFPNAALPYKNFAQRCALEAIKTKIGNASILSFKRSPRGDELLARFASQEVRDAIFDIKQQAKTHYNY